MKTTYILFIFGFILLCIHYSYGEINSTLSLPVIKKCVCKTNEVFTQSGGCIEYKNTLYIQIWNSSANHEYVKDQRSMHFKINDLVCPNNSVLESLIDFPLISEEGELMRDLENNIDHYCIENVMNNNGKPVQMFKTCVLKHSVHLCCEVDEYMDSSNRCTNIPNSSAKTNAVEWFNKFIYTTTNIHCDNNEKIHKTFPKDIALSNLNGFLIDYDKMTHGKFCLGMYGDENELYSGVTYCASSDMDVTDIHPPKVQLCCKENEAYDTEKDLCVPYKETFTWPLHIIKWPSNGIMHGVNLANCSYFYIISPINDTMYQLYPNGSLYTEFGYMINYTDYCLGIVIDKTEVHHTGLLCPTEEYEEDYCPWRWNISRICLGISSFFLVLTLIVYMGIADLRKRIGGVCLISELTALLVSHITLIVIQVRQRDFSAPGCLAAGVIEIVFFLASFFWLNIMCFDVWSTFRVFRPFSEKVFHLKLFIKYSLYAWGIPLLVGLLAIIFYLLDVPILKPNFTPEVKCFFSSRDIALHWFYLYGIILILLLINLGFFVHLSLTLRRNQVENKKHLKRKEGGPTDTRSADIENLKLHGKLFVIMGLPWVIEVFTSFGSPESECYIWFLDLFNMLRGFFIFVIFVCKKSTMDKLIAEWFPSHKTDSEQSDSSSRKISTTTLSLSSWLPSIRRKISKVSLTSGGTITLESFKEDTVEVIKEEDTEKL